MAEYYVEIPKRKADIEFPDGVEVTTTSKGRFCFVVCADEDKELFEHWLDSNGISYQEM